MEQNTDTRTYSPDDLRKLRESRGLSLAELRRETGIDVATLSRIETGARRPSAATALRLSRYYNEPLEKFWTFSKVAN